MQEKLHLPDKRIPLLFFIVGSILFLFIKSYIIFSPYLERSSPVEVDDAYVYMLQGKKIIDCSFNECLGFQTLESQLSPDDGHLTWGKLKTYHKLISSKFFSYGAILEWSSRLFKVDIETVYYSTQVLGLILGYVALVSLLLHFFGYGTVGVALILLSVDVSQTTTWMKVFTPSNFSLILSTMLFLFFPKRKGFWIGAIYSVLFLVILLMHPVSVMYVPTIIIVLNYKESIDTLVRTYYREFLAVACIFLFYKLQGGVDVVPVEAGDLSVLKIILYNFHAAEGYISEHFLSTELSLLMLFGISYLFFKVASYRGLIYKVLLLLLVSMLFYFHNAPAQLFFRLWDLLVPIIISLSLLGLYNFLKRIRA